MISALPMANTVTIQDALAHYQGGRLSQAVVVCRIILSSDPNHFNALNILGAIQLQQQDFDAARASLERAIALNSTKIEAHTNLGSSLFGLRQYAEARRCYLRALELDPDHGPSLGKLGDSLSQEGDYPAALACYRRAQETSPGDPVLLNNCGMALAQLGSYPEALHEYQSALEIEPNYPAALANRGSALSNMKRFAQAAASYDQILAADPSNLEALARGFMARRHICDWQNFEQTRNTLLSRISSASITPFNLLSLTDSGSQQLTNARRYASRFQVEEKPSAIRKPKHDERIRIAYISADFGEHPLSYLMAGVFEQQDRSRFELTGVSLRSRADDAMSTRVRAAFDNWLDLDDKTDRQAAQLLREHNIDIAVDLTGFTRGGRSGIFALRPAPLQLNYLGYPGSMGAGFIDYIIADDYLIPEHLTDGYSEAVARLPNGFQAFDEAGPIAAGPLNREDHDLPSDGWVFCALNASYKINPAQFDSWMRILKQVPGSVLWLLARDEAVRNHLLQEAQARSIGPERLVFASQLPYQQHLARLSLADLFLDTFPFNAGTTASDALRVGLPVLTVSGQSFASRMAGSLLSSLQLHELITPDLASYESTAIQMANGDALWPQLQQRLRQQLTQAPVFSTSAFCRQFEAALTHIWQRHLAGAPPASFTAART